jgi:hypothetical protein
LTLAFFAVGWISPGAETGKLVALFGTALVLWSVTYLFSSLFLFIFTISLAADWLGVIIVAALIGWLMVSIIRYVFPEGWIVFEEGIDLYIGFFYPILYVCLRKEMLKKVIRGLDLDIDKTKKKALKKKVK